MSEQNRVLVIEDDPEISELLRMIILKAGMNVTQAYSGTEGLLQLDHHTYDLILLDLMLPGMSGGAFINKVRQDSSIPIIVISAKVSIEDKVKVLKMGADDYMTKPFNQDEVVARMEVQLRKATSNSSQTVEKVWRQLKMDPNKLAVSLAGVELHVTNAEFDILFLFIHHPERAFSKKDIYEKIWKGTYVGDDNTISVHISNLRRKIADVTTDEYIKTIWGIGFMLV